MSSKLAQFLGMAEKVVRQQAVQTFLPDVPYHGRVSSNPHLYSSMADVTSFAVPACQDPQANIAGVVSISRAHLDAVPESLLSIAALQSSAGEVVRLSSWAKPNVVVLQVIAP